MVRYTLITFSDNTNGLDEKKINKSDFCQLKITGSHTWYKWLGGHFFTVARFQAKKPIYQVHVKIGYKLSVNTHTIHIVRNHLDFSSIKKQQILSQFPDFLIKILRDFLIKILYIFLLILHKTYHVSRGG